MTQRSEHIPFLDHIRGVAILWVVLFHAVGANGGAYELQWKGLLRDFSVPWSFLAVLPATLGWNGVAIFFVVSGFCIHLSHERSRQKSFKVFFLRRFFRIYPPYLLALIIFTLLYPLTHPQFKDAIGQILSHVFLVHNFNNAFHHGINASFWSIAVEVQLYILYPLLVWLVARTGWGAALWITGLIEIGMRSIEGIWTLLYPSFVFPQWYLGSPLIYWFSWTIGAALADAYVKGRDLPFRDASLYLWPFLLLGCYFFKPLFPFCFTLTSLATTYLISYLLSRSTFNLPAKGWSGLIFEHVRWAGIVSYSAYLIQQPILNQVPKRFTSLLHGHAMPFLVVYGVCLLSWFAIFALSYVLYRYVELPSIAWGKRVIQKQRENSPLLAPTETSF